MNTLTLNPTEDTPKIILDPASSTYEISGRSLPEDVVTFYQPVMDWLDEFEASPLPEMNFNIKLEYFNTASSKLILDILMKLEEIQEAGKCSIKILWHFDSQDTDMEEAGEEYSELVSVPFELVSF
jgi:hypothetical protein